MHYHLEIIMPPTENLEKDVAEIMADFSEHENEDGEKNAHTFWDFFVIGGRYAGSKLIAQYDSEIMEKFYDELNKQKIKVSNITFGKQEIVPETSIPVVDKIWQDHFPDGGKVCPIFRHYNDQHKHSPQYPDVMTLGETPKNVHAHRVIVAGPNYDDSGLKANFMIEQEYWNGVCHTKSNWSGKLFDALSMNIDRIQRYKEEFRKQYTPTKDWIVVTVDYHS